MAEQNDEIKMGQVFSYDGLWANLPEEYGVVAIYCDGKSVAYGDSTNDEEILEKNLAGATVAYGDKAILLRKKNGFLTCRRRRREPAPKTIKRAWW